MHKEQLAQLGLELAEQLAYRTADVCDTGRYAGKYRYRESIYLTQDQVALIDTIRKEGRHDR